MSTKVWVAMGRVTASMFGTNVVFVGIILRQMFRARDGDSCIIVVWHTRQSLRGVIFLIVRVGRIINVT